MTPHAYTPEVDAAIRYSGLPDAELARRFGRSSDSIYRRRLSQRDQNAMEAQRRAYRTETEERIALAREAVEVWVARLVAANAEMDLIESTLAAKRRELRTLEAEL